MCEILGALPGTELDEGVDNPAWRVNGKVLARLNPRLRTPDEEERRAANGDLVSVWVERDERELLTRDDPDTFFITPLIMDVPRDNSTSTIEGRRHRSTRSTLKRPTSRRSLPNNAPHYSRQPRDPDQYIPCEPHCVIGA